jgi:peroxiredoxin
VRCQQEAAVIEKEIWKRFKDKGLKVFGFGVKENSDQALSWSQQHQLTYPVMTDPEGELYEKFGSGSVAFHVIIDKKFIICHSEETFDGPQLIQPLNRCLEEKT